jgi:hypothetical protein
MPQNITPLYYLVTQTVINSNIIISKIYKINLSYNSYFILNNKQNFKYYYLIVFKFN